MARIIQSINLTRFQRCSHLEEKKSLWFVVGEERSGKSTLISQLCGAPLKFTKDGLKYNIKHEISKT